MAIAPPPLEPEHETGEKGPWSRRVANFVDGLPGRAHDWFEGHSWKQKAVYGGAGGALALLVAGSLVISGGSADTEDRGVPLPDGDQPVAVDTNPSVGVVDELSPQAESSDLPPCGGDGWWASMLFEEIDGKLVGADLEVAGYSIKGQTLEEMLDLIESTGCTLEPFYPDGVLEIRFAASDPEVLDSASRQLGDAADTLAARVPGQDNVAFLRIEDNYSFWEDVIGIRFYNHPSGYELPGPGDNVADFRAPNRIERVLRADLL